MYSFTFPLAAQQSMFVPERPGQTWSTGVAGAGYLHIEGGLSMDRASFTPARVEGTFDGGEVFNNMVWQVPAMMLRLGIREGVELRLAGMYMVNSWRYDPEYFARGRRSGTVEEDEASGLNVFSVGIKTKLSSERGWFPESAFLVSVALPSSASSWFDIAQPAPDIAMSFSHTPAADLSLGYCGGLSWDGFTPTPMGYASAMLALDLDTRMNLFFEYGMHIHAHDPVLHIVNAGLAFALDEDLIIDALLGFGIGQPGATSLQPAYSSIAHSDFFIGLGAAYRLKLRK
ncbi:MAG: hypothetical protein KFH87_01300 [Bacteroidetes bacterium]|nr:hypothetical protein [Bacteroidota bacterium]